jgi:ectoine hydroxylase-related dioxygenase (phytanoyl-CoA dioxygenase family)
MDVKHIGDTEIVQLAPPAPIDPTYEPKVAIQKLPATGPLEDLLAVLDRDGGLILEDLVSMEQLAAIQKELDECKGPVEEAPVNEALVHIPKQTILVPAIVGRSKTIQELCELPVLEKLRDHCLKDISTIVREDSTVTQTINPLLSCSFSFQITTGAPRQRLHRDDNVHHIKHDQPFDLKKVSQFACLIAGCDTTRENGATMFVPGSHRWGDDRHPKTDEVCFAGKTAFSYLFPSHLLKETVNILQCSS